MTDEQIFCNHEWRAPRGDVPVSVDVNHMCALWLDHTTPHWCACNAFKEVGHH